MKKEIGGYMQLELLQGSFYHDSACLVNSGRNALKCLLLEKRPEIIYVPRFCCNAVLTTIMDMGIELKHYGLDEEGMPDVKGLPKNGWIIYIHYFGIFHDQVKKVLEVYPRVLLDCTQAFYYKPSRDINVCYSPRKFFGVPDGGIYYSTDSTHHHEEPLKLDDSTDRMKHLIYRWSYGAQSGYESYLQNEELISNLPIRGMSILTKAILHSISYEQVYRIRNDNYSFLNQHLSGSNEFGFAWKAVPQGPMGYPYLSQKKGLRNHLISKGVFVAQYWPEVAQYSSTDSLEYKWCSELTVLPIDQRYGRAEMQWIINTIQAFEAM